jgi:hypothetical protein
VDSTCIQSKIIKLVVINFILACFFLSLPHNCLAMGFNPVPTVTVIDDETGKPIEGAVAIAVWRKTSDTEGAWFEGGKFEVVRIEEEVSDSNGNIYIDGFWNWHLIEERYPHLTIYKPGYVCWDQEAIHIDEHHGAKRTDFDKNHRIARMRKWPEGFSFVGHGSFVDNATNWDYTKAPKHLFRDAFYYEIPFAVKEENEKDKKRKEMEEQKRREGQ